jgi:transcriptional regulator with XRE-family HTH domain
MRITAEHAGFNICGVRLCKLLIETREKRGLTQIDVSKKLGRPQSFVSKYENGERRLDVLEFLEVADALGVEPSRFINLLRRS